MMVNFISQCEKKALSRTRRVLDAFADRIGSNAWQTVISQEGLLALRKLLGKTASKNTAVSCHWIRSRARSDLLWVVGNKEKFNREGKVPVNSSSVNRVYRDDREDWNYLPAIRALSSMAALLHDWGKASARFQQKLDKKYKGSGADRLRHEWVSCLLLRALIETSENPKVDAAWLSMLHQGHIEEASLKQFNLDIRCPLADLPDIAKLIAWLVVTHHKLPISSDNMSGSECNSFNSLLSTIESSWGYEHLDAGTLDSCLTFPFGLLGNSSKWFKQIKRWSGKLLNMQAHIQASIADGSFRVLLHHARLSLMLGDHYYSSLEMNQTGSWQNTSGLVANTQKNGNPKQALDQHLLGVYESAKRNVDKLPIIEKHLEPSFNTAELSRKSPSAFSWQDKAATETRKWNPGSKETKKGFFAVNMASTGCGKTFANAKVMMALSEEGDNLRYILALGLRTLTLQTGDEYRERIFKDTDGTDLGVIIGSRAISELHEQTKKEHTEKEDEQGSESVEPLLAESDEVIYDGELAQDGMDTILRSSKDRTFLYAPVLVCTIDHIITATETVRGGRYILPALRLLSSDLVIDEIDDFSGGDLIAIGRLIHLAGMLGRKVMISSATIPPAMAEGYFNSYREGWSLYCKTRNARTTIACAWIDEFFTNIKEFSSEESNNDHYRHSHDAFIEKRTDNLRGQIAKRKAEVVNCEAVLKEKLMGEERRSEKNKRSTWFNIIAREAVKKHKQHNTQDTTTGLNISFGVIRIANISPCVKLTQYLLGFEWPEDIAVRVMAYHSRQVLLLRHEQEKHLDKVLKRKEKPGESPAAFTNSLIRQHVDTIHEKNLDVRHFIFILVATPVEEVGRDHDFDWVIIEPSSYRSIIQLAGRVNRHRSREAPRPNIGLLQYNWRTLRDGDKPREPRFCRPGYESRGKLPKDNKYGSMQSHNLYNLVDEQLIASRLDATPRIQERQASSKTPMALLEHAVIDSQLTHYKGKGPETLQGYIKWYWYLTALPQKNNRFRQSRKTLQLYRVISQQGGTWFTERDSKGRFVHTNNGEYICQDDLYRIHSIEISERLTSRLWMCRNYVTLLQKQAEKSEIILGYAAERYGEISIDLPQEGCSKEYQYNDQLGLFEKEDEDA